MVERIVEIVGTRPTDVVLDVGAGLGGPARRLARLIGCHVVALDALPDVLCHARRTYGDSNLSGGRVTFVAGSADALPVRSESVGQVWSLGVVAHVPESSTFAAEAFRVLCSGGSLVLTESFWEGREVPRFVESAPQPWRAVRADALAADLATAGFAQIQVRPWPGLGIAGALDSSDPLLREDLADGRIVPMMIVCRRP